MQAQSKTTAGQMQALQESTYLLKAALGDALLPAVTTLIEAITPLVLRFTEWAKQNPELVATIFAIGAVLGVLGAIMLTLTAITFVLGATIGGIAVPILAVAGLIISVLIAAIVFLIKNWDLLKANIESIWIQIQYVIRTAIDNIKSAIETWFGNLKAQFSQSLDSIKNKVSGWVGSITGFFDTIIGKIRDAIGALKDFLGLNSKAGGESYSHYQHGGTIPGAFNQPVPIIAHGGERIIPKTGTDVNTGGGGGVTLNLTIQGDVNSEDMLDRIVDSVKSALGRDNELAAQGVSV
jgi:phage-related protein